MDPKNSSSTFMNNFFWYFFQTLTVFSMLLMVLSISWTFYSSSIQVICVITVAFAIISPSFIIPKLPQIAAVAIPMVELNNNIFFQVLNIVVWMFFGFLYPLPANILCYSLMTGVGLLKLYSDGGSSSVRSLMTVIGRDALRTSMYVFGNEMKYGTGRWGDSSTGIALLGLHVVTLLAHYVPPLVKPEKKNMMMNEIEAIFTKASEKNKKKKKKVNVAEAPILGSGTKSFLETV